MRRDVERLVLPGRRDLENARKNIGIEAYEVAAFLSHQAVEKNPQTAWIPKKRARSPATHSLRELGQGLEIPRRLAGNLRYTPEEFARKRREPGIVSQAVAEGLAS